MRKVISWIVPGCTCVFLRAYRSVRALCRTPAATKSTKAGVEISTGGLIVNLGDRCAIVWISLPFPICKIGKL